jgi:origin recognition complex subunit 4
MGRALSIEDGLVLCRNAIKRKLLEPKNEFRGHKKERTHLSDLVRRTVEMGESNSALLIGPRGCGKTAVSLPFSYCRFSYCYYSEAYAVIIYIFLLQLLHSVLSELKNEKAFYKKALVVELNGLMHTDDRLALKDATRQMQLETAVGSKVFGSFAG